MAHMWVCTSRMLIGCDGTPHKPKGSYNGTEPLCPFPSHGWVKVAVSGFKSSLVTDCTNRTA